MTRIADNVFLLTTMILAFCSWLIAFVGACVFRRGLSGGSWWIVVYELLLIIGTSAVLLTHTYAHYRMLILTFLAASIAMLTYQLDYALPTTKFVAQYQGGAGAYAAGYIILIMIQFLWVFIFGSESDSYFGRFGPTYYGNAVGISQQPQCQQQPAARYEMTGDKTALTDSAAPYGTVYNNNATHGAASPPTHPATTTMEPTTSDMSQPNDVQYREKVQALHAYQANPDDPNELNFAKGETLDIVDRNGNWWQARKADGTVGIIPSNYFGSSP